MPASAGAPAYFNLGRRPSSPHRRLAYQPVWGGPRGALGELASHQHGPAARWARSAGRFLVGPAAGRAAGCAQSQKPPPVHAPPSARLGTGPPPAHRCLADGVFWPDSGGARGDLASSTRRLGDGLSGLAGRAHSGAPDRGAPIPAAWPGQAVPDHRASAGLGGCASSAHGPLAPCPLRPRRGSTWGKLAGDRSSPADRPTRAARWTNLGPAAGPAPRRAQAGIRTATAVAPDSGLGPRPSPAHRCLADGGFWPDSGGARGDLAGRGRSVAYRAAGSAPLP